MASFCAVVSFPFWLHFWFWLFFPTGLILFIVREDPSQSWFTVSLYLSTHPRYRTRHRPHPLHLALPQFTLPLRSFPRFNRNYYFVRFNHCYCILAFLCTRIQFARTFPPTIAQFASAFLFPFIPAYSNGLSQEAQSKSTLPFPHSSQSPLISPINRLSSPSLHFFLFPPLHSIILRFSSLSIPIAPTKAATTIPPLPKSSLTQIAFPLPAIPLKYPLHPLIPFIQAFFPSPIKLHRFPIPFSPR